VLEVSGLTTRYGAIAALRDASLTVGSGEVVGLIGPNGAGKTTLLNTIAGLLQPESGTVRFDGNEITGGAPEAMLRQGLALVPEHRRIFTDLTVEENLLIGGFTQSPGERAELLEGPAKEDQREDLELPADRVRDRAHQAEDQRHDFEEQQQRERQVDRLEVARRKTRADAGRQPSLAVDLDGDEGQAERHCESAADPAPAPVAVPPALQALE